MIGSTIRAIGDGLKGQPVILALVIVNLLFLLAISAATIRKDALLADLVKQCVVHKE
jgi:hypothetical protein